jgi:hypothetical protein
MSLAIDTDKVVAVCLNGAWHEVNGESFDLDSYEFFQGGYCVLSGGQVDGVVSTGFRFIDKHGNDVVGPMTSITALRLANASSTA